MKHKDTKTQRYKLGFELNQGCWLKLGRRFQHKDTKAQKHKESRNLVAPKSMYFKRLFQSIQRRYNPLCLCTFVPLCLNYFVSACISVILCGSHGSLQAADIDHLYTLPSLDHGGGLFHNFMNVLGFLDECEKKDHLNFAVDFGTDGHYFESVMGPNWWEYYFEPIRQESLLVRSLKSWKRTCKVATSDRMDAYIHNVEYEMAPTRAHELIAKYVRPKPDIQSDIEAFVAKEFAPYTIGIHYRATDKMRTMQGFAQSEAPEVQYESVDLAILGLIQEKKLEDFKLFIATDSEHFLERMRRLYPGMVIATDSIRSTDGSPLHYNTGDKPPGYHYKQGREAVIDCMLLAKCNHMIKTSSNLNLCATFFNPKLAVTSLSERSANPYLH